MLKINKQRRDALLRTIVFGTLLIFVLTLFAACQFFQAPSAPTESKKYAIIVGINDYIHNSFINDLHYSANDANSMTTMLAYNDWKTISLIAESGESLIATKEKIKEAFDSIPSDTTDFLFYYSGHGDGESQEQAYIIPSDYNGTTNSKISTEELSTRIDTISAKNKIIILDSCYSGGFAHSGESIDAAPGDYQKGNMTKGQSSAIEMLLRIPELLERNSDARSKQGYSNYPIVISAAGWDEFSYEQGSNGVGHGIFTKYLLEAGTEKNGVLIGDYDRDSILSVLEAYRYAREKINSSFIWNEGTLRDFLPRISGGLIDIALLNYQK